MPKRKGRPTALRLSSAPMPAEPVTKAAFARLLGCGPARVTEWCRRRILAPPAATPDGLVVPSLAVAALAASGAVLPAAEAPPPATAPTEAPAGYDASRARHEAAKAGLAELELARQRGELVEIEVAETVLFETFRSARDAWLNWPLRVGPLIAADMGLDAEKVTGVLTTYVHQQLVDLGEPQPEFATNLHSPAGTQKAGTAP